MTLEEKMMLLEKKDRKCPENLIPDWNIKNDYRNKYAMIGSQEKTCDIKVSNIDYSIVKSQCLIVQS